MKILEYQAHSLFGRFGIPSPRSMVVRSTKEIGRAIGKLGTPVVVKAQILAGRRGKAGAVKRLETMEGIQNFSRSLLGTEINGCLVDTLLIQKAVDIRQEFYVGITVDRTLRTNVFIVSPLGGVEIEEVARAQPLEILKVPIKVAEGITPKALNFLSSKLGLKGRLGLTFKEIARSLYRAYIEHDLTLAEINPLVLTKQGNLLAVDAKVVVDDNALWRQKKLQKLRTQEVKGLEAAAKELGLTYVELDGDMGIIGNGAGLVMATMDEVKRLGGRPANFLDIGGGATPELVERAVNFIQSDPKVRSILLNVFGGITRCDEVAKGILRATGKVSLRVPLAIRMLGTNEKEGIALLKDRFFVAPSLEEIIGYLLSKGTGGA